jgi:hypothetical protein
MDDGDANVQEEEEIDELQSEEDVSALPPTPLNRFFELTWQRMYPKHLPQSWSG